MEFRGTKEKWYKGIGIEIISIPNQIKVAKVSGSNYEEGSYNALLISKSPEMLKMIKLLVDRLEENNLSDLDAVSRAKELIKQATEI